MLQYRRALEDKDKVWGSSPCIPHSTWSPPYAKVYKTKMHSSFFWLLVQGIMRKTRMNRHHSRSYCYQFIAFFVNNNLRPAAIAGMTIARMTLNAWSNIPASTCEIQLVASMIQFRNYSTKFLRTTVQSFSGYFWTKHGNPFSFAYLHGKTDWLFDYIVLWTEIFYILQNSWYYDCKNWPS
jgi:hypothetical protein